MKKTYTSTEIKKALGITNGEFISYTRADGYTTVNGIKTRVVANSGDSVKGVARVFSERDLNKFKIIKGLSDMGCNRTFAIKLANSKSCENELLKVTLK